MNYVEELLQLLKDGVIDAQECQRRISAEDDRLNAKRAILADLATDNPWAHFRTDSPLTVGRLLKSDSPST